jgi:hypothetical protein
MIRIVSMIGCEPMEGFFWRAYGAYCVWSVLRLGATVPEHLGMVQSSGKSQLARM